MDADYSWKVSHPTQSNNTVQMRSLCYQPSFYAGGNQVPFHLGIKGNYPTNIQIRKKSQLTPSEKVFKRK